MTPEQLLNHMKSFKYGIYIENGKQHVQQPENLEKLKLEPVMINLYIFTIN